MKHSGKKRAYTETIQPQGCFVDENGRVHIRVPNLGDAPVAVVRRRERDNPVTFETVRPKSGTKEQQEEPHEPVHRLERGSRTLLQQMDERL